METPGEVQGVPPPVAFNARSHVSIWRRLKGLTLKKLFLVSLGIGVGLGVALVATFASITWFTSRPIPAREWPRLEVEAAGLRVKLKTDWNDSVRYQLVITPRSDNLKTAFDNAIRSHRDSISFTIHLYDKAGFELCKQEGVKPTPFVDASDRFEGLRANDTFLSYECPRSNYKEADRWSLSYVFPTLTADTSSSTIPAPNESKAKAKPLTSPAAAPSRENTPSEEDDTLTGFDYLAL